MKWSPNRDDLAGMARLKAEGHSYSQIARAFGCEDRAKSTIANWCARGRRVLESESAPVAAPVAAPVQEAKAESAEVQEVVAPQVVELPPPTEQPIVAPVQDIQPTKASGPKQAERFGYGLPDEDVPLDAYVDPFGGSMVQGLEGAPTQEIQPQEEPKKPGFFKRLLEPLPPLEDWEASKVPIMGGAHFGIPVEKAPDWEPFKYMIKGAIEEMCNPYIVQGHEFRFELPDKDVEAIARPLALPVMRIARAGDLKGPLVEVGHAVFSGLSLVFKVSRELNTNPQNQPYLSYVGPVQEAEQEQQEEDTQEGDMYVQKGDV